MLKLNIVNLLALYKSKRKAQSLGSSPFTYQYEAAIVMSPWTRDWQLSLSSSFSWKVWVLLLFSCSLCETIFSGWERILTRHFPQTPSPPQEEATGIPAAMRQLMRWVPASTTKWEFFEECLSLPYAKMRSSLYENSAFDSKYHLLRLLSRKTTSSGDSR